MHIPNSQVVGYVAGFYIEKSEYTRMEEDSFEHIDTMLRSVQEGVTDSELRFKLRTARQLLDALKEQYTAGQEALEMTDIDKKTLESLRQLGYLD